MDNKVRKNSIYSLLKAFSQVVFPLITFPYISRVLHAENVGKVNFGNSIISYVSLAASLGITTYAVRECSKIKDDKNKLENMVGQIISLNMVTTFIAYIGLALALLAAKPLENYREMIIILSTTVLFTTLGADWLNTAMEDFKYITVRTFLFQLVSIAAMLLFVQKPEDYMRYVVITVIASSGANITNMVYRRKFCKTKLTLNIDWKRHLPPVLLLFVMVLAQTIYCNSDITILGIIKGNYEVGLYSTSVKIYSLVNSTIASIAWVVMPQMTKNFNEGNYDEINKLFRYAFNFVVILGLPCVVGINILCPEIIEIIAGIIFLCLEIHDYRTLYSMAEADAMYGGLADFCKYKENVFCPAFFWIIVILTGISYWKNKKLYWILTQALVFMVFFRAMFPFYAIFIELNPVVFYILPLLYSTVFFVVERKLFKIKQIDSVDITVKTKIMGIGIGILCTIIYFLLFLTVFCLI